MFMRKKEFSTLALSWLIRGDSEVPIHRDYFQHDRAPPHYVICVRRWLDLQFPVHWIGRRGPVEWPPKSPVLTPLDFYLWRLLKAIVYQVKIQNMDHLRERIRNACARLTPDLLKRVSLEWERHICMCYQCTGAHIEHVL
jgi:hypothetical protein